MKYNIKNTFWMYFFLAGASGILWNILENGTFFEGYVVGLLLVILIELNIKDK